MESISTEALMESISTEALMESINSTNQVARESIGREYLMELMRREASLEWTSKKATRKLVRREASLDLLSSDSPSSSNSGARTRRKYDVFLSFRGEDTRLRFTGHLYDALCRKGIHTFRDDEELERGGAIGPELLKAIEESRFAIVVLSKNYVSSSWCLEELAKILECRQVTGLIILPVFYDVEPSEVRKQTFEDAFAKHEQVYGCNSSQTNKWRLALTEIAGISGWDLKNKYESEVIKEIAKRVSNLLNVELSSVNKDFVGMDSRKEKVLRLLDTPRLDEKRTIGIWGMGGLGKTAISEQVFIDIQDQFEASCFISNVRETAEKQGLVHLQELMYHYLLQSDANIQFVSLGINMLSARLQNKKVLIVLDNVGQKEQIDALGLKIELGPGSRIILTTRDAHLLKTCGVNDVYEVEKLTDEEALRLFCQKAFKRDDPLHVYEKQSEIVIKYANGLPLALEVLGSFLHGRELNEWSSTLESLKEHPDETIMSALQLSFDGLKKITEKKMFLDIACFFKGESIHRVKKIFESCNYYPDVGIKVLIERSLITVVGDKLWMHDLLQVLGWHIVRQESPEEPGKRSRLCVHADAHDVLVKNRGTETVEGIFLSFPQKKELRLKADSFSKMNNLRLLNFYNVSFSGCHAYLSNELRFLEWHGYPLKSVPSDFQPENLVELNCPNSHIELLWKRTRVLEKLISINLSDCPYLSKTPDFSMVPNLEKLVLKGCARLTEVHSSIGVLKRLIVLDLGDCERLKRLPNIKLKSLKIFNLSGCLKLDTFPEIEVHMKQLSALLLDKTAIKELPTSIERLSGLIVLSLNHCTNLVSLPTVICSLRSLKALYLLGCSRLDQFPENLGDLECLQELDASETAAKKIPSSILLMKNLEHLSFRGCKGVTPRLWRSLFHCCLSSEERSESTTFLQPPESLSGLISLRTLDLSSCNLPDGAIPVDIGRLSSLESLDLSENNFTTLPDSICELSQLRELRLNRCRNLKSLPALPSSIKYVHVHECASLETPSNDREKQTSSNEGFSTPNCQGPDHTIKLEFMDQVPVSDEYIQPLVRKYFEGDIYQRSMYDYIFWQERIPDWWSDNSSTGSCTAIQLPSDFASDSCWLGFALCFLYLQEGDDLSNCSNRCLVELLCHFVTDEGELAQPLALPVVLDYNCQIYGACKFIPREWFGRRLDNASRIRVSVSSGIPSVKVKLCLTWLVSEHNVADFVGNEISELDVDTVAEEDWFSKHVVEFKLSDQADQNSVSLHLCLFSRGGAWSTSESSTNDQSCSTDLTNQLRRRLHFVLARLFKEGDTCNTTFKERFPVRAIYPFFSQQSVPVWEVWPSQWRNLEEARAKQRRRWGCEVPTAFLSLCFFLIKNEK